MDIKKTIHTITNKLEGLSLAIPMFVVGLGFILLGVTIFPGIGIVVGVFAWWVAWRFMLSSTQKSRIKESLKRIREKQAFSQFSSKYQAPTPKPDVKNDNRSKSTDTSEK